MILPSIYIKEYCSILVPRTGSLKNTSTGTLQDGKTIFDLY